MLPEEPQLSHYEAARVRESLSHLVLGQAIFAAFVIVVTGALGMSGRVSSLATAQVWGQQCCFYLVLCVAQRQLLDLRQKYCTTSMSVVQLITIMLDFTIPVQAATMVSGDDHDQHKWFLVIDISLFFSCATLSYVPDHMFNWVVCPFCTLVWGLFTYAANEFNTISVCVGVCVGCMASALRLHVNTLAWKRFQATCEVRRQRRRAEEAVGGLTHVLAVQRSLLVSLFDAYCICDADGRLTFSSQVMNNLLVGRDSGSIGECLWGHAASDEEAERVRSLLQDAASGGVDPVRVIQTSLKTHLLDPTEDDTPEPSSLMVNLYCITLPFVRSTPGTEREAGKDVGKEADKDPWTEPGVFIGVKLADPQGESDEEEEEEEQQEEGEKEEVDDASAQPQTPARELHEDVFEDVSMGGAGSVATPTVMPPTVMPIEEDASIAGSANSIDSGDWRSSVASQSSAESPKIRVGTQRMPGSLALSRVMKAPRGEDGKLLSVGSKSHASGCCVPCKFMKVKRGCRDGVLCNNCHFPHVDVGRAARRRRGRITAIQKRSYFEDGIPMKEWGDLLISRDNVFVGIRVPEEDNDDAEGEGGAHSSASPSAKRRATSR